MDTGSELYGSHSNMPCQPCAAAEPPVKAEACGIVVQHHPKTSIKCGDFDGAALGDERNGNAVYLPGTGMADGGDYAPSSQLPCGAGAAMEGVLQPTCRLGDRAPSEEAPLETACGGSGAGCGNVARPVSSSASSTGSNSGCESDSTAVSNECWQGHVASGWPSAAGVFGPHDRLRIRSRFLHVSGSGQYPVGGNNGRFLPSFGFVPSAQPNTMRGVWGCRGGTHGNGGGMAYNHAAASSGISSRAQSIDGTRRTSAGDEDPSGVLLPPAQTPVPVHPMASYRYSPYARPWSSQSFTSTATPITPTVAGIMSTAPSMSGSNPRRSRVGIYYHPAPLTPQPPPPSVVPLGMSAHLQSPWYPFVTRPQPMPPPLPVSLSVNMAGSIPPPLTPSTSGSGLLGLYRSAFTDGSMPLLPMTTNENLNDGCSFLGASIGQGDAHHPQPPSVAPPFSAPHVHSMYRLTMYNASGNGDSGGNSCQAAIFEGCRPVDTVSDPSWSCRCGAAARRWDATASATATAAAAACRMPGTEEPDDARDAGRQNAGTQMPPSHGSQGVAETTDPRVGWAASGGGSGVGDGSQCGVALIGPKPHPTKTVTAAAGGDAPQLQAVQYPMGHSDSHMWQQYWNPLPAWTPHQSQYGELIHPTRQPSPPPSRGTIAGAPLEALMRTAPLPAPTPVGRLCPCRTWHGFRYANYGCNYSYDYDPEGAVACTVGSAAAAAEAGRPELTLKDMSVNSGGCGGNSNTAAAAASGAPKPAATADLRHRAAHMQQRYGSYGPCAWSCYPQMSYMYGHRLPCSHMFQPLLQPPGHFTGRSHFGM